MTGENELENINENAAPLEGAEGSAGSSGAEGSDVHPIYEVRKQPHLPLQKRRACSSATGSLCWRCTS